MRKHAERLNENLGRHREVHKERNLLLRIAVFALALVSIAAGVAMLVLPGPGILFIAIGLGLLSLEFHFLGDFFDRALERVRGEEPSKPS